MSMEDQNSDPAGSLLIGLPAGSVIRDYRSAVHMKYLFADALYRDSWVLNAGPDLAKW
jgi:hypothetical protein